MKLDVEVTQKNIDAADKRTCCKCPIALSINRELKPPEIFPRIVNTSVHMGDGHCTLEQMDAKGQQKPKEVWRFELPKIAQDFVKSWEHVGSKAKPISFSLDLKKYKLLTVMSGTL